jgi:hypothetical protein
MTKVNLHPLKDCSGRCNCASLTHEAEPFLRSCQLCSYSRTSQDIMEPESSLPCSQELSTGPYPEPDQSNPYHPILSKTHLNIVHTPTSWSSQWSHSVGFPTNILCAFRLSPIRATYPAHLILLDLIIIIILGEAIVHMLQNKWMGDTLTDSWTHILTILFWSINRHLLGSIYLSIFLVTCGYLLFVKSLLEGTERSREYINLNISKCI